MAIQFVGWSVAKTSLQRRNHCRIGGLARILVTAYLLNPWGRKRRPYDFKAPVLLLHRPVDLPNSLSSSALYTESLNMNLGPSIHFIANTFFELSLRDSSKRGTGKINWLY